MRSIVIAATCLTTLAAPALARGQSAHTLSTNGLPPEVVAHEPDPHALMTPFKVFLVDDGSCPPGQIKRYTRGSAHYQTKPVRECIAR